MSVNLTGNTNQIFENACFCGQPIGHVVDARCTLRVVRRGLQKVITSDPNYERRGKT